MEHPNRCHRAVVSAGLVTLAACVALIGVAAAAQPSAKKWPPQFPRAGATKLFENDHVVIWEQVGRPKEPFAHKHNRDIHTLGLEPGRVQVLGPDLQRPAASAGPSFTQNVYSRGSNSLSYSKAGLGPHVELAPDPNDLPISIFVEIKGTEPPDCAAWSTGCE